MELPREIDLWRPLRREGFLSVPSVVLALGVCFNLYALRPEAVVGAPLRNEGVIHVLMIGQAASSLLTGNDPVGTWLSSTGLGSPLSHYYGPLPYFSMGAIYILLSTILRLPVTIDAMYGWSLYLLLSIFPLSVFLSARRFGLTALAASLAGLLASLISTNGLFGFDYSNYLWRGDGRYDQLWGIVLLPLAVGEGYSLLRKGRGLALAAILIAATVLSDFSAGLIALGSLLALALVPLLTIEPQEESAVPVWRRLVRLAFLGLVLASITVPFLPTHLLHAADPARGSWEAPTNYDSYGQGSVLGALVHGDLLDFGRFPALSLLAGVGLLICLVRWRKERWRAPAALTLFWLVLYFGRPTWGALVDLLPLNQDIAMGRFIAGVQLGAVLLAGLALALVWEWSISRRKAWLVVIAAFITAFVLLPPYHDRLAYLAENNAAIGQNNAAYSREASDIQALVSKIKSGLPGRTYAGPVSGWGRDYRVGDVPLYALLTRAGLDTMGTSYPALSLNADAQRLFDETKLAHYEAFNVRYVVAPSGWKAPSFMRMMGQFGHHVLYEVNVGGYLELAETAPAFSGTAKDLYLATLDWLGSTLPAAETYPVVYLNPTVPSGSVVSPLSQSGYAFNHILASPPPGRAGRIVSEEAENQEFKAQVEVQRQATLIYKLAYQPNWIAEVDGAPVSTLRLLPNYIGVQLQPGTHVVRLRYQADHHPIQLLVLPLLGLAGAFLVKLYYWRSRGSGRRGAAWRWLRAALGHLRAWLLSARLPLGGKWALHSPFLAGVFLFGIAAGLPLLRLKVMAGHDVFEYLSRNQEFYHLLELGNWLPGWAPDFGGGYGQPFFLFNPPVFYYITALFHYLGFGFAGAASLASLSLLLIAGFGMYLFAARLFGPSGGLAASAAYVFAPYLLVALYVRHGMSDFSAFAFIPFVFWGLSGWMEAPGFLHFFAAALGTALLVLSANPVALMALPALAGYVLWISVATRSKASLVRGGAALALGLGLSCFFWLPALLERGFVQVSRLLDGPLSYTDHFVYPSQFLRSTWGYGFSVPGPDDEMSFAVGAVHLAMALVALVLLVWEVWQGRRRSLAVLNVSYFLILLVAALFMASVPSQFVWDAVPLLQYLAYPWRFLFLAAVSSAFLCGAPLLFLRGRSPKGLARLVALALIILIMVPGLPDAKPSGFMDVRDGDYTPQAIATRRLPASAVEEYEPVWVRERPKNPAAERLVLTGDGTILAQRVLPEKQEFLVKISQPARARLNTSYFPGWTLYVDGVEAQIDYRNPEGLIDFSLGPGTHELLLVLRETPTRRLALVISGICLLILVVETGYNLRLRFRPPTAPRSP